MVAARPIDSGLRSQHSTSTRMDQIRSRGDDSLVGDELKQDSIRLIQLET